MSAIGQVADIAGCLSDIRESGERLVYNCPEVKKSWALGLQ